MPLRVSNCHFTLCVNLKLREIAEISIAYEAAWVARHHGLTVEASVGPNLLPRGRLALLADHFPTAPKRCNCPN
jgi:hypothetical protein